MTSQSCFSVIVPFCLGSLLFLSPLASGQPAYDASNSAENTRTHTVETVSGRIAAQYGADAGIARSLVQAAVQYEQHTGVPAAVVVAIALQESGLTSPLFRDSGNPFGIKASNPWTGPTYTMWHDGEETRFRVYNTAEEAVTDFGNFVRSRRWYADALTCPAHDYTCVIDGLKKTDSEAGYSMDPNWDEAVLAVIEKTGLRELEVR